MNCQIMWKKKFLIETWRQFLTSRNIQTIQKLKKSEFAEVKFPTPSGHIAGKIIKIVLYSLS